MVDIRIENGRVIDPETRTSYYANLAIKDGLIFEISENVLPAKRVIDAGGLCVCPGFIDVHGHLDGYNYGAQLSLRQGITTTVGGNCGLSPDDFGAFFQQYSMTGFPVHQAECVGHSFTLRKQAGVDDVNARATPAQLDKMLRLANAALANGAAGISLGLDYSPGASLAEIHAMANLCAQYGRVLPVHTRLFTQNDLYSLYEILDAGKRSGVRLLLSHFVYQYSGFGSMKLALEVVDTARESGLDVLIDSGMYTDWATYINTATFDEQTIRDNSLRFGDMVVATGKYTGTRLNRDLYLLLRKKYPDDSVICYSGAPFEIYETLKRPYAMMSTDCGVYAAGEGHPQIAGSYPRFLRKMVREHGYLSIEEAIYKCTLLPALTYGFPRKGRMAEGFDADITLFNPVTVYDNARMPDKGEPDAPPDGIPYVIVNGKLAVDNNACTGVNSGKLLKF